MKKIKRICCYLSGEAHCTKNDCFLVGIAGLMLTGIIYGWIIAL